MPPKRIFGFFVDILHIVVYYLLKAKYRAVGRFSLS